MTLSGRYTFAIAAVAMLSGCGDPKKEAVNIAYKACQGRHSKLFELGAMMYEPHATVTEDAAAKRYVISMPIYSSNIFGARPATTLNPCIATVENGKVTSVE